MTANDAAGDGSRTTGAAPPVTVAVPSIGRLKYLPTLRAALDAQTMGDLEVLVLDNASPPEAQELFADWARADSRVRVLRVEPRIEMFTNFNRGYLSGRGKYLLFCHDDDEYTPRFVQAHYEFLEREPEVQFSGSNNDFMSPDGRVVGQRRLIKKTEAIDGRDFIRFVMRTGRNLVPMQTVAYRMTALAPRGIDDTLPCNWGDFVLMMRMAERGKVGAIAESLVRIRQHPEQWSVTDNRTAGQARWKWSEAMSLRAEMLESYLAEFRERWPRDTAFTRELERGARLCIRKGALWGWVNAVDDGDAAKCLEPLDALSRIDRELAGALRVLSAFGPGAGARKVQVASFVRKLASVVRV